MTRLNSVAEISVKGANTEVKGHVDPHIDRAELGFGPLGGGIDLIRVSPVSRDDQRCAAEMA